MARIIVTTDAGERLDAPVLLEERVRPVHLSDSHAAAPRASRPASSLPCCSAETGANGSWANTTM